MAKIRPLRAVIYNPEKIKNLSQVVCPPYDIISSPRQQYYHDLAPHNFIRILLGKDIPGDDKYKRAASHFKDWLEDKIFIQDEAPTIYFYSQQYTIKGEKKTRIGFIALLGLEEGNPSVFAHEHTRLEPKEDRLRLLKAVKANLSPIFVLFCDKKRIIQRTYQQLKAEKPFIDIVDDEKIAHKLWRISSPIILADIQKKMLGENIFIADGHHRYEVACMYRDQIKKRLSGKTSNEDFNYILSYFTNTESRDLTILPTHRLVKYSDFNISNFIDAARKYFDIEEIKDKTRFFFLLEKAGGTQHVIGMYNDNRYWLLRLKNIKILDTLILDKPPQYRLLDVSILNHIIFKKILSLDLEDKERITFNQDAQELIEKVDSDASYIAFLLNPAKIQQVMSVALSGHKMPPKSTYFYPKVLSGLVINKHGAIR